MLRELKRTAGAISGATSTSAVTIPSISANRAWVQLILTAILVPLCLWVLFGTATYGVSARNAAAALLGAVVTFWLKD